MNQLYPLFLLLLSSLILLSCTSTTEPPTVEHLTNVGCSIPNQDLFFTITNIGSDPLALEGSTSGHNSFAVEVNNIELTGLVSYCGRQTLAKNEVVKCRRPGQSNTDAGIRLHTGRGFLLMSSQNTIRTTVKDTTRTIQFSCQ